ncbi:MAG: type 1 glutamine amidotransferase [Paracoccaceae bacterium]
MKIGILQTGHAPAEIQPETGDYPLMFERLLGGRGFTFRTWSVVDGDFPENAQAAEGWLVTGSRHGAYEDHPWIPPLETLIREIHAADLPMIGVCFGHQIIAQALGGEVAKFPGGWAVGRQVYDWQGREVALNAWHQDQVIRRPEGAQVVAANPFCENAALLYEDRIFTVQPHPEFDSTVIDGLIRTRGRGLVPDTRLDAARATLEKPVDQPLLAEQFARFLTERRLA